MECPQQTESCSLLEHLSGQPAELMRVLETYLEQLDRGQAPDAESLVAQYPEMAEELRGYLQKLELLHCARAQMREAASSGAAPLDDAGAEQFQLGDFTILREVGRGGMGIVYEAEQRSLGRRVALKVLPFAAALNAKQLERFKHEAEAAARLQHPNIVPVYAVGCERGIHFYAMQFIDGTTLAGLIEEMRRYQETPDRTASTLEGERALTEVVPAAPGRLRAAPADSPRPCDTLATLPLSFFHAVARIGIQAAEALEHAHQLGIVHRDIKPANVLIDMNENAWLTDFGLARFQREAGLTQSGDRLGTLRYMSPEQASARHGLVDQRTDIYSLGATLYELVTRRPAFPADEPQEILSQLSSVDPPRPRSIDPAIPLELETIIQKAMAKAPAERYGTSQEFADDLRRFLDDQPILARRPTLPQRLRKWTRRHRAWVTAAALAMLLAMLGLAVSTGLIWIAHQDALTERDKARANEQKARAEKERAEQNLDLAVRSLLELLSMAETFAEQSALDAASQKEVQKLLQKVVASYDQFAQENHMTPHARSLKAEAYQKVGDIHQRLIQPDAAEKAYRDAASLFAQLVKEFPQEASYRAKEALCHRNLGRMQRVRGQLPEAEATIRTALATLVPLTGDNAVHAKYHRDAAGCYHELGVTLSAEGRSADATAAYRKGLESLERLTPAEKGEATSKDIRAGNLMAIGLRLEEAGQLPEAEERLRQALVFRKELAKAYPSSREYKYQSAAAHHNHASILAETGHLADAEATQRQGLALLEELAAACPSIPSFRKDLSASSLNLARYLDDQHRTTEALQAFTRAVGLLDRLAQDFPAIPDYRKLLALALNNEAHLLARCSRSAEAVAAYRRALGLWAELARQGHHEPEYRHAAAATLHNLAALLRDKPETLDEARQLVEQAILYQNEALKADPQNVRGQQALAAHIVLREQISGELVH
jgi:serine/threonine protein kinase